MHFKKLAFELLKLFISILLLIVLVYIIYWFNNYFGKFQIARNNNHYLAQCVYEEMGFEVTSDNLKLYTIPFLNINVDYFFIQD